MRKGIWVLLGVAVLAGCADADQDDVIALRDLELDACQERGPLPEYELSGPAVDVLTEGAKELTAQWMGVESDEGKSVATMVTEGGHEAILTLPADPSALSLPAAGASVTLRSFVGFPESGAVNNVTVSDEGGLVAHVVFAEVLEAVTEAPGFSLTRAATLCQRPADACQRVLVDDTIRFDAGGVKVELNPGEDALHSSDAGDYWIYLRTAGHREYGVYEGECSDETAPWVGYVIVRSR